MKTVASVRDKPTAYGRATLKGAAVPAWRLDGGSFEPEQGHIGIGIGIGIAIDIGIEVEERFSDSIAIPIPMPIPTTMLGSPSKRPAGGRPSHAFQAW